MNIYGVVAHNVALQVFLGYGVHQIAEVLFRRLGFLDEFVDIFDNHLCGCVAKAFVEVVDQALMENHIGSANHCVVVKFGIVKEMIHVIVPALAVAELVSGLVVRGYRRLSCGVHQKRQQAVWVVGYGGFFDAVHLHELVATECLESGRVGRSPLRRVNLGVYGAVGLVV